MRATPSERMGTVAPRMRTLRCPWLAPLLLMLGTVVTSTPAVAQSDWAPRSSSPHLSALPRIYAFETLVRDLDWSDVHVNAEQLASAYGHYLSRMDELTLQSQPHLTMVATSTRPRDFRLKVDDANARRLRAHQDRILSICTSAEDELWDALAQTISTQITGNADAEPAQVAQRLSDIRSCRRSELLAELAMYRSGVIGDDAHIPLSATRNIRTFVFPSELNARERAAVIAAMNEQSGERTALWLAVLHELGDSTLSDLAARNQQDLQTRPPPEALFFMAYSKTANAVRQMEVASFTRSVSALPPALRARAKALTERIVESTFGQELSLPGSSHGVLNPRGLGALLLRLPDLTHEQRSAARTLLEEWFAADDAAVDQLVLNELHGWEQPDSRKKPDRAPRQALATAFLAKLQTLTGALWLTQNGIAPPARESLVALAAEDAAVVGSERDWELDIPADFRWSTQRARAFMLPVPLAKDVIDELIRSLAMTDAQRTVANILRSDMEAAWAQNVAPRARHMTDALESPGRTAGASQAQRDVERQELVIAAIPERRAAWVAATMVEDRFFSGLLNALGSASVTGTNQVRAAQLAHRMRGIIATATLRNEMGVDALPNLPLLAMELRATPDERATLVNAVCTLAPRISALIDSAFEASLELVERNDHLNLKWMQMELVEASEREQSPALAAVNAAMTERNDKAKALVAKMVASIEELKKLMTAELSDEVAARFRRSLLMAVAMPSLLRAQAPLVDAVRMLGAQPESEASRALLNEATIKTLDAWEARCDAIIADAARETVARRSADPGGRREPAGTVLMSSGLFPSLESRVALICFQFANQLPAEQVAKVAPLAKWKR